MTVPFLTGDIADLYSGLKPEHRVLMLKHSEGLQILARDRRTLAVTCVSEDGRHEPIAVFGCRGDGEVFIFPSSSAIARHKFTFLRDLRREINRIKRFFGLVTSISEDRRELYRFFEHLGFRVDGGAMIDGKNYIRWRLA